MDEQLQGQLVKAVGLGKRARFAHKAGQALAQRVVPTLDVCGLSAFLAHGAVGLWVKGRLIRLPQVAAGATSPVALGDALAQSPATVGAAVADEVGDNLARATAKRNPEPAF